MFKGWKLYTYHENGKGYWNFGIAWGNGSVTLNFAKWGFNVYKDDF